MSGYRSTYPVGESEIPYRLRGGLRPPRTASGQENTRGDTPRLSGYRSRYPVGESEIPYRLRGGLGPPGTALVAKSIRGVTHPA